MCQKALYQPAKFENVRSAAAGERQSDLIVIARALQQPADDSFEEARPIGGDRDGDSLQSACG